MGDAARTYTLLTIGDGLVAQIPALLLSSAVAIIVTRMSRSQDMGGEISRQLFGQPKALYVAAGVDRPHGPDPGHAQHRLPRHRRAVRWRRPHAAEQGSRGSRAGRCRCGRAVAGDRARWCRQSRAN